MKRYEISDHTAGGYADPHEHGSCSECQRLNPDGKDLYYLASEADAKIEELASCGVECSEGFKRMQARIAELERICRIAYADGLQGGSPLKASTLEMLQSVL